VYGRRSSCQKGRDEISFLPLSSGTNAVNAVIGICLGDRGSAVGVTAGGKINESDFSCP